MRLNHDCANFEPVVGHVAMHAGSGGVRSAPMGRCRLSLMGLGGCPSGCPNYRPN